MKEIGGLGAELDDLHQQGPLLSELGGIVQPDTIAAVPNPFGDVGCIRDSDRFFDRDDLLAEVFSELDKGTSISLVGDSEIGKSSLLWKIYREGSERMSRAVDQFIHLSLQDVDNEDEFYECFCDELGMETRRGYQLARALRGRSIVLCIDEIEKLGWEQFGFTIKVRSHLRGLADGARAPLTLVLVSRTPLAHCFPDSPSNDSPLYNICRQIDVPPFTPQIARAFIDQRLNGTGLSFSHAQIDDLLLRSGCHPARLQQSAHILYRQMMRVNPIAA